jgi:uncharacterized transporter YbjL
VIDKNVGGIDRWVRAGLAVVLAVVGVAAGIGLLPRLGAVGAAVALAASAGFAFNVVTRRCVGNYLLGIDTCPAPDPEN